MRDNSVSGAIEYCVGVYDCNREYGGSEEGGWWFNTGSLVHASIRTFEEAERAYRYARRMQKHINKRYNNRGSYSDKGSVLCDGVLEVEVHEGNLPGYYPRRRPHYC